MKKFLFLAVLSFFLISTTYAKHQYEEYSFSAFWNYKVKGSRSDNYYQFQSDLIQDKGVIKEIKNKKKTGLVSYLLFEDDKIKIDEHDLPWYIQNNGGLLPSHSVGKSLVSYVTGYAICEGYIDNVDVKLDDWPVLNGTLYEGQKLIDLLNVELELLTSIQQEWYKSYLLYELALYQFLHGKFSEALINVEKAIHNYKAELDIILGNAILLKGIINDRIGNREIALSAYEKVIKLDNNSSAIKKAEKFKNSPFTN